MAGLQSTTPVFSVRLRVDSRLSGLLDPIVDSFSGLVILNEISNGHFFPNVQICVPSPPAGDVRVRMLSHST